MPAGAKTCGVNRKRLTLAALAFPIAFLSSFILDSALAASLQGSVIDRNGNNVPGVLVSIARPGANVGPSVYTNRDGRFFFLNITDGSYQVQVHWGDDLVYRRQHLVAGDVDLELRL